MVGMRPGSVGSDLRQALIAWWRSAIGEEVAGSGEWSSAALNLGLAGLAGLQPVVAAASVTEGRAELHLSVAKGFAKVGSAVLGSVADFAHWRVAGSRLVAAQSFLDTFCGLRTPKYDHCP